MATAHITANIASVWSPTAARSASAAGLVRKRCTLWPQCSCAWCSISCIVPESLSSTGMSMRPAPWAVAMINDHAVRSLKPTCIPTQRGCANVAQHVEGDHDLGYPDDQYRKRDGEGVSQSNGWKGLQDRTPSPFLQAQGYRKEPAHRRVEAVVGSQQGQCEPGPAFAHET